MPCRVDTCARCGDFYCPGDYVNGNGCTWRDAPKPSPEPTSTPPVSKFDTSGALCDVLSLLEEKFPKAFKALDKRTIAWWRKHEKQEQEKIKQEALAKLTPREKRALGLK